MLTELNQIQIEVFTIIIRSMEDYKKNIYMPAVQQKSGKSSNEFWDCVDFLKKSGYIEEFRSGFYGLTLGKGMDMLEKLQSNGMTKYHINIEKAVGSAFGDSASVKIENQIENQINVTADLKDLYSKIKTEISNINLSEYDTNKINSHMRTIEVQLDNLPDSNILNYSLKSIKNVIENALGGVIANNFNMASITNALDRMIGLIN
ncbi:MAG: hypothetical protein HQM06_06030 [Magnetococcales bacterium]|nr:hypothetical protein [Magnetococcales bacterium]